MNWSCALNMPTHTVFVACVLRYMYLCSKTEQVLQVVLQCTCIVSCDRVAKHHLNLACCKCRTADFKPRQQQCSPLYIPLTMLYSLVAESCSTQAQHSMNTVQSKCRRSHMSHSSAAAATCFKTGAWCLPPNDDKQGPLCPQEGHGCIPPCQQ
jgi:hypothetical protein